jgi:hypothetical protein
MALGFAGTVRIGFRMVEKLRALRAASKLEEKWEPETLAQWWPKVASEVFQKEAQGGEDCELMLLSAHPTQDLGIPNWAKCSVYLFRSPNFDPDPAEPDEIYPAGSKTVAIGCGNELAPYRALLDRPTEFHTGRHGPVEHGLFTSRLLFEIRSTIFEHPTSDVSPILQLCTVNRLHVDIINANGKRYAVGGGVTDFTVPRLATNLDELRVEIQDEGNVANARC